MLIPCHRGHQNAGDIAGATRSWQESYRNGTWAAEHQVIHIARVRRFEEVRSQSGHSTPITARTGAGSLVRRRVGVEKARASQRVSAG